MLKCSKRFRFSVIPRLGVFHGLCISSEISMFLMLIKKRFQKFQFDQRSSPDPKLEVLAIPIISQKLPMVTGRLPNVWRLLTTKTALRFKAKNSDFFRHSITVFIPSVSSLLEYLSLLN